MSAYRAKVPTRLPFHGIYNGRNALSAMSAYRAKVPTRLPFHGISNGRNALSWALWHMGQDLLILAAEKASKLVPAAQQGFHINIPCPQLKMDVFFSNDRSWKQKYDTEMIYLWRELTVKQKKCLEYLVHRMGRVVDKWIHLFFQKKFNEHTYESSKCRPVFRWMISSFTNEVKW